MPNPFPIEYKKALLKAARIGDYPTAKALLNAAGNIDQPCKKGGTTALLAAASNEHTDMAKQLIADGADVNVQDSDGMTALFAASQDNNIELAIALLEAGADANKTCIDSNENHDESPLIDSAERDQTEMAELLILHGANVNHQNSHGDSALQWAVENNNIDLVKTLLHNKANPNIARPEDNLTPLYLAAQSGFTEIARLLLNAGADPTVRLSDTGETPLMVAVKYNYIKITEMSLARHASNINQLNTEGDSALHLAAEQGAIKTLEILLSHNANPNIARSDDGATPLYLAAEEGHDDVIKALLAAGADPTKACTDDGKTPIDAAEEFGNARSVRLLKRLPPPNQDRLEAACCKDHDIPDSFIDAQSLCIMDDPVTLSNGQTYDRETLNKLFHKKNNDDDFFECPKTRDKIDKSELKNKTNFALKTLIDDFVKKQELRHAADRLKKPKSRKKGRRVSKTNQSGLRLFDSDSKATLEKNTDSQTSTKTFNPFL